MKTIKRSIAARLAAMLTLQFYNGVFLLSNNTAHAEGQPLNIVEPIHLFTTNRNDDKIYECQIKML